MNFSVNLFPVNAGPPGVRRNEPGPVVGSAPWRDYIRIMSREVPEDVELIRRMTRRETLALRELYSRHGRLVFGLALRIVGDQEGAEEITQDVFLRAWEKADTYRHEKAQVRTWLARITRNRAIDVLRRRVSKEARARDAWEEMKNAAREAGSDPASPVEVDDMRGRISQAILSLPQEQRYALSLAFFDGLTHRQIAEATGEPLGTVKSRIRGAMLKLREMLQSERDAW
ncbi:MAG TPA: sigma-70 family RNA polymerase sigma factor [Spirochaetia bacterium]|nr:sigma-70 family RNA polymerase sigma factor [Spirochaetia bacterium]